LWNQDNPLQEGIYSAVTFYVYGEAGGAIVGGVWKYGKVIYQDLATNGITTTDGFLLEELL